MVANNFKHATLTSKGQTLINGRSLVNMEKSTFDYVKKALTHVYSFLDSNKQLPSGKTVIDLLNSVLDKMWEENLAALKSKKNQNYKKWMVTVKFRNRNDRNIGSSLGMLLFVCLLVPFSLD